LGQSHPPLNLQSIIHVYEVRPRKDYRGFDLISDALPFGRMWYAEANAISNAIGYAQFYSRSHDAVINVYDAAGNVIRKARTQRRFQRVVNSRRAKIVGLPNKSGRVLQFY
jgi:hypothetical protein